MSTLEQVRFLAGKIEKAVETIKAFKAENLQLKEELAKAKAREEELESLAASYKSGNDEVDDGIAYAIKLLDEIELEDASAPEIIPAEELSKAQAEDFNLSTQEEESLTIELDNDGNGEQLNIF